jgi:hypothetical protein
MLRSCPSLVIFSWLRRFFQDFGWKSFSIFSDRSETMHRFQGTTAKRSFEYFQVCSKVWNSPCSWFQDGITRRTLRGRIRERILLWRSWDKIQPCLQILKGNTTKESFVYKKFVFDLHEITLADFLLKYSRNTACGIRGKAEWWDRCGVLSDKELSLTTRKQISQLWPIDEILQRNCWWYFLTFGANNGGYKVAPAASFNIQCGQYRA